MGRHIKKFKEWKGKKQQVDDIIVLCVKVNGNLISLDKDMAKLYDTEINASKNITIQSNRRSL